MEEESEGWSNGYDTDLDYTPSTSGVKPSTSKAKSLLLRAKRKLKEAFVDVAEEGLSSGKKGRVVQRMWVRNFRRWQRISRVMILVLVGPLWLVRGIQWSI